ncbi:uncharacterized protein F5Z01DRAFT_638055 [Emericellopsis atlantica]|uniref:Uncharacterized protein n=1 Tax=Emericellopsis atlantica TaxID=2614577 RepID=A0A9P7ZJ07_9HYPO|nr:uncharacterized protein F5Z01DRAFT_638055 [Emericellopsis atlantica]KAG9252895.1 hypothetical protein F5Z01DRAFT_638055 [Emericellopsis atlantica]
MLICPKDLLSSDSMTRSRKRSPSTGSLTKNENKKPKVLDPFECGETFANDSDDIYCSCESESDSNAEFLIPFAQTTEIDHSMAANPAEEAELLNSKRVVTNFFIRYSYTSYIKVLKLDNFLRMSFKDLLAFIPDETPGDYTWQSMSDICISLTTDDGVLFTDALPFNSLTSSLAP